MTIQIAQRIGRALGVTSATKTKELDEALRAYVRSVGPGATLPIAGSLPYANLTGVPATFPPSAHTHAPADVLFAATSRILGRIAAGAGAGQELTAANVATIIAGITQIWTAIHTFGNAGNLVANFDASGETYTDWKKGGVHKAYVGLASALFGGGSANDFGIDCTAGIFRLGIGGAAAVDINGVTTTGASTGTFSTANKPGANAGVIAWLPVRTAGGTQGYVPIIGA